MAPCIDYYAPWLWFLLYRDNCLRSACNSSHMSLHQNKLWRTWHVSYPKSTRCCGFRGGINQSAQRRRRACDRGPNRIRRLGESHRRCRLVWFSRGSWDLWKWNNSGTNYQGGALKYLIGESRWIWLALIAKAPFARGFCPAQFYQPVKAEKVWSTCRWGTQCWWRCSFWGSLDIKC